MDTEKTNYEVLGKELLSFAKEIRLTDYYLRHLEEIKDYSSFRSAYIKTFKGIGEKIGIEVFDSDDMWKLEEDNEDLQIRNRELEQQLETLNSYLFLEIKTLEDDFKLRFINEHWDEFSAWEMNDLFKNGKEFLKTLKK